MNTIDKCLDILERIENRSYRGKTRIVITVEDVSNLADLFLKLNTEDRDIVRECVSEKVGRIIVGFTMQLSAKTIDTKDTIWLKRAIVLHLIEGFSYDPRENMREFLFLTYAANCINADLKKITQSVAFLSSEHAWEYMKSLGRNKENISLEAHGFREERVNDCTKFARIKET